MRCQISDGSPRRPFQAQPFSQDLTQPENDAARANLCCRVFGQPPPQPWNKEGCGYRTLPFASRGLEGQKCPLSGPDAGRAGSNYGMLVKAAGQGRKRNHGSPFPLPVPWPPRATGLLMPKEGSRFAVLLPEDPSRISCSQSPRQERVLLTKVPLPALQPSYHPQVPSLLLDSSQSWKTALDIAVVGITTAMTEV